MTELLHHPALGLVMGIVIALLLRAYKAMKPSEPFYETLLDEAKAVLVPALAALGGLLVMGESIESAALTALTGAAVALGLGPKKDKPAGLPKGLGAGLLICLIGLNGCFLPKVLGKLAQAGQYAGAAIDAAEAASDRFFLSHPSLEAQPKVADALAKARAAVAAFDAAVAAGEEPSPAAVANAYAYLYALLKEFGVLGGKSLGGPEGPEGPDPALYVPEPFELAKLMASQ